MYYLYVSSCISMTLNGERVKNSSVFFGMAFIRAAWPALIEGALWVKLLGTL